MQTKNFLAGQRFRLADKKNFVQIKSGRVGLYAITRGEVSFRQSYMLELGAGEAVFPAIDNFGDIDFQIYAVEDSEIEIIPFESAELESLREKMRRWFWILTEKISWLTLLADKGDDTLIAWRKGEILTGEKNLPELLENFADNQEILSMFLGVRFTSEDKILDRRTVARDLNKKKIVDDSISFLLGEEVVKYEESGDSRKSDLEELEFVVRCVAKKLKMPTENIKVDPETARRMDAVVLLRRLMQKGNMQMRLVSLPDDWHKGDTGVLIGYFGENKQPAAFLPADSPGKYTIVTKDYPAGIALTAENEKQVSKDAFVCYGGFPTKELSLLDLIKFMFNQCWKLDYRTIILTSLVAGMIPLATPIITETIFQDIIPILDRQGLATVTEALMVTSFTTAALSIVRSIAVMRISTHIEISAESALWGRLMALPTKFFRRYTVGELASRMGGLSVAKSLISGEFVGAVFGFVFSFWSIFLMCYYSFKLTAAAVGVWLVYSLVIFFVYRKVLFYQRKLIEVGNRLAGTVQQIFAGLAKFRAQGAEEQAYYLWAHDFGEHWNWSLKLRWLNNYNAIIGTIQPFILTMLLYYVAIYGMQEVGADGKTVQGIGYAQFLAFNAAYSSFNGTLSGVLGFIGTYFSIQPQLENLRPILKEIPESTDDKADASTLSGAIEVNHLSFAYEDSGEVLHDLNFKITAGENVAIVGRSGCGKSTLVRLLLGFEKPKNGAVYYDGQDLAELSLPSVRTQMGVVLQNGQLMTGDIFTNIVGTRLLTQQDAWEAAEAAGIAEDIAMMPMGMQTIISEGSSNISGGQRQRILIARALVNKPSILIFDEATSALDNRSQGIVTESLNRLNATRIIVAHRLSTIRGCDKIIVMDSGRIVESGGFDELVAKGGLFAELVKRQVA